MNVRRIGYLVVDCEFLIYVLGCRLRERRESSGEGTNHGTKRFDLIRERTYRTCLVTVGI